MAEGKVLTKQANGIKIKRLKPTSPGQRGTVLVVVQGDTDRRAAKGRRRLSKGMGKTGGRNSQGGICCRHKGGGHKRRVRHIEDLHGFQRRGAQKAKVDGIEGRIERIEQDPNRSAVLGFVVYTNGHKGYVLGYKGMEVGHVICQGKKDIPVKPGNRMPLGQIPVGTTVFNLEDVPGKGGQLVRAAGGRAIIVGHDGRYARIRLRSTEEKLFLLDCMATVGEVGKSEHNLRRLGKAGRSRHRGIRSTVRGVAMNPIDHPHGGGEGRTSGGGHPVSPWGWKTKGKKTRRAKLSARVVKKRK